MAATCSVSTEDAKVSIRETGVYYLEDALDIRDVVQSILERPHWGLIKVYSDRLPSDQAFFFHNPSVYLGESQIPTLLVQLWSPESQVVFYEGAHLQNINPKELEEWGLLALPRVQMKRGGITESEVWMAKGGLAVMDSRLGFTVLKGYFTNIGFATDSEIRFWAKMELPDSKVLRAKVEELKRRGFETNFTFVEEMDSGKSVG
ncbi:hypothetical protein F5883DRAFT_649565 [Diaporthe sp. PMI_573]|nr:hypothetical protein F5883DRAFT_649565 [Diaporthaceae sp. PMI_573]